MTAPLCLNSQVIDALGDWPLWTYAIASSLYGDPTDKGMPAYQAVIKRYKAEKNAPDPWHIVAFGQLLTTVRFLNEAGAGKAGITPEDGPGAREGVQGPAGARVAEAPVRQVQGRAGHLQRHVPGVHLPGQVRVQAGVRLDRAAQVALDERRPSSDGAGRLRPRRLILTGRRERDPPLPPARPRDRGDDRRHRGRHRRHLPGLRLHQPGGGRDRHARRLLLLGAPHRRARLHARRPRLRSRSPTSS